MDFCCASLLRSRYWGRSATLLLVGEALRDDPNNGFDEHALLLCIIMIVFNIYKLQILTVNIFHTFYCNYFFVTGL